MTHKSTCDQRPSENPAADDSRPYARNQSHKPAIPDAMLAKWQRVVDLMSKIFEVRAALIVRLDPPQIEILAASVARGNPYKAGLRADLGSGLYCEKVMALCRPLLVRNALAEPQWHGTPQLALGMIFYVGFPLLWPDGEIFGTICLMDDKQNASAIGNQDLILQFKEMVEADLVLLTETSERRKAEEALKESERKYRHLVENANDLILIAQDGMLKFVNAKGVEVSGYSVEELTAKPFIELVHPDDRAMVMQHHIRRLKGQEQPEVYGFRIVHRTGEVKWLRNNGVIIEWEGRPATLNVLTDMTETKRAEEKLETLAHQLLSAQEEERQMISRELHDRLAQELSSLKIGLDTLFDGRAVPAPEWRRRVTELSQSLQHAISAVRDLSYELRPPVLTDLGLVKAVFQYCMEFQEKTGVQVDFFSAGIDEKRLDPDTQINLYRMVQEGLNNIKKHADAGNAVVRLVASSPDVILRIEDDGKGFDVKKRLALLTTEKRMGLRSIEERVKHLKGRMTLRSTPGRGTRVMMELPLKEEPDGSEKDRIDR
jgi:PAS domain S-box-containing protein